MGSKGGVVLLEVVLTLAVLCHLGSSLECYSCMGGISPCTTVSNCTANFDACVTVKAELLTYYHCWRFDDCTYDYISKALGEDKLTYLCCQKDRCNRGAALSGTMALLATPLLAGARELWFW
ncbi:CD59 glycoprotein, partial [Tupaia chinensis]